MSVRCGIFSLKSGMSQKPQNNTSHYFWLPTRTWERCCCWRHHTVIAVPGEIKLVLTNKLPLMASFHSPGRELCKLLGVKKKKKNSPVVLSRCEPCLVIYKSYKCVQQWHECHGNNQPFILFSFKACSLRWNTYQGLWIYPTGHDWRTNKPRNNNLLLLFC